MMMADLLLIAPMQVSAVLLLLVSVFLVLVECNVAAVLGVIAVLLAVANFALKFRTVAAMSSMVAFVLLPHMAFLLDPVLRLLLAVGSNVGILVAVSCVVMASFVLLLSQMMVLLVAMVFLAVASIFVAKSVAVMVGVYVLVPRAMVVDGSVAEQ